MAQIEEYAEWPDIYATLRGFTNLFPIETIVQIKAEYLGAIDNKHKVRIRWYPEARDNDGQIRVVSEKTIKGIMKPGSIVYLNVEYIAYHRHDYHTIVLEENEMNVYKSLFKEVAIVETCQSVADHLPQQLLKALEKIRKPALPRPVVNQNLDGIQANLASVAAQ